MKGYVYMIDYKEEVDDIFPTDQMECSDKNDLLKQITMIANGSYEKLNVKIIVVRVKLVKDDLNQRDIEKLISKSLLNKIIKTLGYKIETY